MSHRPTWHQPDGPRRRTATTSAAVAPIPNIRTKHKCRGPASSGEIPWGDTPPFRAPAFVVTHRGREVLERQGGTSFTFVTDGIERAIELAKDAAGGKDVAVSGGGTLLRQVLAAGLLDELELHIAPVLLGDGMRLFDGGQESLALVWCWQQVFEGVMT
jgi:dihydrofolate reductase